MILPWPWLRRMVIWDGTHTSDSLERGSKGQTRRIRPLEGIRASRVTRRILTPFLDGIGSSSNQRSKGSGSSCNHGKGGLGLVLVGKRSGLFVWFGCLTSHEHAPVSQGLRSEWMQTFLYCG